MKPTSFRFPSPVSPFETDEERLLPATPSPTDSGFVSALHEPRAAIDKLTQSAKDEDDSVVSVEIQRLFGAATPTAFRVKLTKDLTLEELHRLLYSRFPVFTPAPEEGMKLRFAGEDLTDLGELEDGCVVHWVETTPSRLTNSTTPGSKSGARVSGGGCRPANLCSFMSDLSLES